MKKVILLIVAVIVLLVGSAILFWMKFPGFLSSSSEEWANFGSFIGGSISSVFASLSFIIVLLVYRQSNGDRRKQEVRDTIYRFLEELSKRYEKISVTIDSTTHIGEMVFSYFNGEVFNLNESYKKYQENESNFQLKEQVKSQALKLVFPINTIREYLRFIVMTFRYISENTDNDYYLSLLSARLTEQEKMSLAILLYNEIEQDEQLTEYLNSLNFGPIDGFSVLGKTLGAAQQLYKVDLPTSK